MKVFISQPMNGRTDEEIKNERNLIQKELEEHYHTENIEIIDSFFENAPHDTRPLWFLGRSIELLSTADLAVFADNWEIARGCEIEYECAMKYGITTMFMKDFCVGETDMNKKSNGIYRATNKTEKVLEHLETHGSITSLEAIELYGATRLSAIIYKLRKNYHIDGIASECTDRYGNTARYTKYIFHS